MSGRGLLVRMQAKQGKERAVEEFLRAALPMVQEEVDTTAWFAVRFGRGEYGIFDVFPDDAARDAHLRGPVANALKAHANELLTTAPRIEKVEVITDKLPVVSSETDTKGMLLTFTPKAGHEQDVEEFLRGAREFVDNERRTTAWFAMRTEDGRYAVFDVFPRSEDRLIHLMGLVPRELAKQAFNLLGSMPDVELLNIHAEKIGADTHEAVKH